MQHTAFVSELQSDGGEAEKAALVQASLNCVVVGVNDLIEREHSTSINSFPKVRRINTPYCS